MYFLELDAIAFSTGTAQKGHMSGLGRAPLWCQGAGWYLSIH